MIPVSKRRSDYLDDFHSGPGLGGGGYPGLDPYSGLDGLGGGFGGGGLYQRGNTASLQAAIKRAGRRERKEFEPAFSYYYCISCHKIEPKWRVRCTSCGEINSMRICPPKMAEAHERFMKQPLRREGASDDDEFDDDYEDERRRGEEGPDDDDDDDEDEVEPPPVIKVHRMSRVKTLNISFISTKDEVLDHVLCGGAPAEHCLALAAPPGTGKSTLMRRAAGAMSDENIVMYVSGEESEGKIKSEFARAVFKSFPYAKKNVLLASATNPESIVEAARSHNVDVLVVDSLSTMVSKAVQGAAGGQKQMVHAASIFMDAAHGINTSAGHKPMVVLLILHATKGGDMAGANAVKHIIDGAFFMEHIDPLTLQPVDDQNVATGFIRIRAHGKYRAGEITRVGYYKMTKRGLIQYKLKKAMGASSRASTKKPAARRGGASGGERRERELEFEPNPRDRHVRKKPIRVRVT